MITIEDFKILQGQFTASINALALTANRTFSYPNKDGTVALLSDIPSGSGSTPTIITITASKTLALTDASTIQLSTASTAVIITVPTNATAAFPIGTGIEVSQDGTGSLTISSATGVTINRNGSTATTGHLLIGQYTTALLRKVGTDAWRLYGAVA